MKAYSIMCVAPPGIVGKLRAQHDWQVHSVNAEHPAIIAMVTSTPNPGATFVLFMESVLSIGRMARPCWILFWSEKLQSGFAYAIDEDGVVEGATPTDAGGQEVALD